MTRVRAHSLSMTPTEELSELGIVLEPIFRQIEAAQNVAALLEFGAGRSLRLAVSPAFALPVRHERRPRQDAEAPREAREREFGTRAPVVEYSREFLARASEELASLPHGSAIAEMLSDYAVMREQGRVCRQLTVGALLRKGG